MADEMIIEMLPNGTMIENRLLALIEPARQIQTGG